MKKINFIRLLVLMLVLMTGINSVLAGTSTTNINQKSSDIMFVASMTDGGDKYYSNKYFRAWMWNGSANQVISSPEWITMTGANYGGVAYCILSSSWILNPTYNIKYALNTTNDGSWTNAWQRENDNWTQNGDCQWLMWRTGKDDGGAFEAFNRLELQKITYPDAIAVGEEILVNVFGTGGFPWFYKAKLNNSSEAKKYKLVVTNKLGTEIENTTFKYSEGSVGINWTPASTTDNQLTFTLSDNDDINIVSYTHTFTVKLLITFDATENGGSDGGTTTQYVNYNSSTALTSVSTLGLTPPTGYHFDHWSDGVNNYNDAASVTLTTNKTLTAVYAPNTYSITYKDCNSSDFSGTHDDGYPTTHTYASATTLYDASKTGYTFNGWYADSDCSGYEIETLGETAYTSDITLYAKWNANIILHKNGGSTSGSATTIYKSDADLDIISAPSHATGYYILGYYADEECTTTLVADADGKIEPDVSGFTSGGKWIATEDKTLYTKWSNEYTVTLDDQSATVHATEEVTATYYSAMPAISIPRKTGYLFGGYFADLEDPDTKYYDENGVSAHVWNIDHDATLYAKWNGISYTVSFDPNGGTGTMADQNKIYGTSTQLSANTFTRDGYYFLGWNTEPDGAGTKYKDEKYVSTMTTSQGAIVTLYAQWAKKHTLYFLNMGVSGWKNKDYGEGSAGTTRYAYAYISYDGDVKYPLGTYATGTRQGTQMTAVSDITLTNVNSGQVTWCWKIDGVPEGSTIIFSDNTDDHKSSDQSGWSADKPYFCNGNSTWYALDEGETDRISSMTEMSVYIGAGDFGSWKFCSLDQYNDGTYAIIWLNTNQTYQYQYYNWRTGTYSGATTLNAYTINGCDTKSDFGGPNGMNGSNDYMVKTNCHASGEYKFLLTWSSTTPQTTVRVPRGVNLTTTSPTEAKKGESVTVSFTADAWNDPSKGSDKSSLTYYFEYSKDNSNWSTIATVGPLNDQLQATATYTMVAHSCYFRVKLVNANGVASYSGSTAFTAYTTKSFYVYNPWYNENWSTLHLYTWNDAGSKPTYNGSFPGHDSGNCEHGNAIENKGNGWYYITIDERADKFQLVGNETYNDHKTEDCSVSNYIQDAKYMIKTVSSINKVIEYEAKGSSDFRLKYTYGTPTKTLYSPIYNTTLDGTTITTSMWMDATLTSTLEIEQGNGDNSWVSTDVTYSSTTDGIGGLIDIKHRDHGYVFTMKLNTSTPSVSDVEEYTGSFYVRTDGLDGGWNKYQKADHMMHYSKASLDGTPEYDYYLCKWVGTEGTNVKFTVANDYNPELVASLEGDATDGDPLYNRQTIPDATNVRFAWNSQTNTLTRAYLSGASAASSRFLVLVETGTTGKIYNASGIPLTTGNGRVDGLNEHELLFDDNGNWVYQLDMQANPGAQAKVTAKYNGEEPEFIPSTTLIGGGGESRYSYRIVYDFKTNILTNAWVADGNQINQDIELNSNVMIIRVGQGNAVQLTFGTNKSMSEVKKVYGVMQFNRSTINDESISRYKRDLYWISFPFDVRLKDAFGMGTYGTHWIIEYYDGQGRAAHGFWADSPSNWKFVTPAMRENGGADGQGYILKANEGYILALDLDELGSTSPVWENDVNETYLYFPSSSNIGSIQNTTAVVDLGMPVDYQCTINRGTTEGDRRIKDSYWHCIGVPSYANVVDDNVTDSVSTLIVWNASSLPFLYQWKGYSTGENTLEVVSTSSSDFTFKPMYSYLVQYNLRYMHWSAVTNHASVAARITEMPDRKYSLALNFGEEEHDRTLLRLTDEEGATNRFEFNYDLSKEYNAGRGNIWTVTADTVEVAGNSMPKPVQTTVVPVGVKVVAGGEYTLAMPEGTNGEDVYLIDNAYGTRTNLGLMPYTVTLTAGTYDSRFALEFAPIQDSPTSLENDGLSRSDELNDAIDTVRKVFVGGRLYILRDGKVYDAAGQRIE